MSSETFQPAAYGEEFRMSLLEQSRQARRQGFRRVLRMLAAGGLVVALSALGAVAYAALPGRGPQPETQVPADALVFVKVDLDLSPADKLVAKRFFGHFPGGDTREDDVHGGLLRPLLRNFALDYDRDVAMWLGERGGVAVLPPPAGTTEPVVLAVLASTDDVEAAAALRRIREARGAQVGTGFGYVVRDGWVVLSGTQGDVETALAEADRTSLSEAEVYRGDLARLGERGLLLAWADSGEFLRLLQQPGVLPAGEPTLPALPGLDALALRAPEQARRFVLSVALADNYLQIESRTLDSRPPGYQPQRGVFERVQALPFDTLAAVGVSGGGATAHTDWAALESEPAAAALLSQVEPVLAHVGLAVPDLATLLGDHMVLSIAPDAGGGPSSLGVRTVGEPARTQALFDRINAAMSPGSSVTRSTDDGAILASDAIYADRLAVPDGGLGGTALFKLALPDAESAMTLGYAHLAPMVQLGMTETPEEFPPALRPLAALGVSSRYDGDDLVTHARLVVR